MQILAKKKAVSNKQTKKKHSNASDGTEGSFTDKRYNLTRKHRNHRPLCA